MSYVLLPNTMPWGYYSILDQNGVTHEDTLRQIVVNVSPRR